MSMYASPTRPITDFETFLRAMLREVGVLLRVNGGHGYASREESRPARKRGVVDVAGSIWSSKDECWKGLLSEVDSDSWGFPFRLVTNKLGSSSWPLTAGMTEEFPAEVVAELFPRVAPYAFPPADFAFDRERYRVTEGKIRILLAAALKKHSAPGSSGVHYRTLGRSAGVMCSRLSSLYTACFEKMLFPKQWRRANLGLLEKSGRDPSMPGAYRLICLLNYDFLAARSTIDALVRVRDEVKETLRRGGVAIVVFIGVKNAFNSVPWSAIRDGLVSEFDPDYLVSLIGSFLSERKILYEKPDKTTETADVFCGVSQGSVLEPLLWNIEYDIFTRTVLPKGCSLICYADDTLLHRSRVGGGSRLRRIETSRDGEGHQRHWTADRGGEDAPVPGGHLRPGSHFRATPRAPRTEYPSRERIVRAPDAKPAGSAGEGQAIVRDGRPLRGPVRPVWAESMAASWPLHERAIQLQRASLNKVVTAYRKVAAEVVCLLSATPPLDLLAMERFVLYRERGRGGPRRACFRRRLRDRTVRRWQRVSTTAKSSSPWTPEWGTGWQSSSLNSHSRPQSLEAAELSVPVPPPAKDRRKLSKGTAERPRRCVLIFEMTAERRLERISPKENRVERKKTCVRFTSGFTIDLTVSSGAVAARVSGWEVLSDFKSLSDHAYVAARSSKRLTADLGKDAESAEVLVNGRDGRVVEGVLPRPSPVRRQKKTIDLTRRTLREHYERRRTHVFKGGVEGFVCLGSPNDRSFSQRSSQSSSPADFPYGKIRDAVTEGEVRLLFDAASKRHSASGPKGSHSRRVYRGAVCAYLDATLWKEANLVLLDKPARDPMTASAYRPIWLLDVEGKLFERVIVSRVNEHLRSGEGRNDLSLNQYDFRAGRSTTDALDRVCAGVHSLSGRLFVSTARSLREKVIQLQRASLNKVAMAYRDVAAKVARLLSGTPQLDLLAMERLVFYRERDRGGPRTANTWQAPFNDGRRRYGGKIVLTGHGVFGSYLARKKGRSLDRCCGTLPTMNAFTGTVLPESVSITCYADDTLLLVIGHDWAEARKRAELGLCVTVEAIHDIGLRVRLPKTESCGFHSSIVMAYRDVAADAACVLLETPLLDLLALKKLILYRARKRSRRDALRKVVRESVLETWRIWLEDGRKLYGGKPSAC
ncbi:conserved hypothetical protein [Pediculus humanus corporis]|uniref:Reverse transcriptase domain-containing protein n=1 Tax=Pediculus humanus subsp. corporis TaxID=121224 RepID=E0VA38_PEDHC|nr:uncharacterized protein Phum_PHUM026290 [Pediculus humanus corporis]EEB10244.1 conserved hypothetical protein [Pediculus humanus corporis]